MEKKANLLKFDFNEGDLDDSIDWEDFIIVQGNFIYHLAHLLNRR
jgi:hypothetical protein